MWRNWYTRTFEGRVALPCEFESRHPHEWVCQPCLHSSKTKDPQVRILNLFNALTHRIPPRVTWALFIPFIQLI